MLLFDDERIEVPKAWINKFKQKYGTKDAKKAKVNYKMDKRFDYFDKVNNKIRRSNSQAIESFYSHDRQDANGILRYALHKIPGKKDEAISYKPDTLSFESNSYLYEEEEYASLELYYFLDNHPKNRANNPGNPVFYLEDIEGENKVIAVGKKDKLKAYNMIWHEDESLELDELKEIGMALGLSGVKAMGEDQVKNRLDNFISTPTQQDRNPAKTFISAHGGAKTAVLSIIQEAIEEDIIIFNLGKRAWSYSGNHEKAKELICSLRPGMKQHDGLADFLLKNHNGGETLTYIELMLKEIKKGEPA